MRESSASRAICISPFDPLGLPLRVGGSASGSIQVRGNESELNETGIPSNRRANERTGERLTLTGNNHPRKQLLAKLGRKHCAKMYCDLASGDSKHVGYIAGGQWFRIYEVHDWQGKAAI